MIHNKKKLNLSFSPEQAQFVLDCIDLAVKTEGLRLANMALETAGLISQANLNAEATRDNVSKSASSKPRKIK